MGSIFAFPECKMRWSTTPRKTGLKRYCSRSVLSKKREQLEVIKSSHKPCSTIPLIRENRLNPFDSVALATLCFEILRHQ